MKRIVLAAALLLAAVTAPAAAAERVVLQLRWDHQYQFAGYYAALWQGYYEEAGLEVEIRPAVVAPDGAPLTAVDEVASGRAEFGVGGADILLARDRGEPLVVLASIFQQSAAELYALLDTELFSPADLTRLRILRRPGDLIDIELQAVLRAEGIDPEAIGSAPRPAAGEGWRELVEGRIDVLPGYRISAPYFARRAGVALRRLRPAAYGVSFYGDSLFTHERVTGRDAGLVQRFTAASRRGWAYALEHAEEVADRITAELPRTLPIDDFAAFNRFQIQPVREVTLYPTVEPGHVNPERWRRMHELLARAGLVTRPLDLAGFVFDPAFRERERLRRLQRYLIAAALLLAATASVAWIATLRHSLNRRTATIRSQAADLAAANARLRAEIAERGRAERQRRLVTAEVDHRAKNMLAAVQAMAHQTRHGSPSLDAFAESFEGRIAAMARAHDLLSRGRWEGVGLRALVAEELAPYHAAGDDRVEVDGEDLLLPPKAALSLGMALHELATNAAKYGALSAPAGRVRVAWTVEGEGEAPEGTLALHWRETGGPPVTPPERRGFGSTVIGRSLAYELDGSAEMDFAPGGVRCTIRLPLRR
ncbi:MAG TPA: ABC transporter substrate-binding protein, partial [Geminicoccaceae bacterium]|nr:ABC transporter substrate-binding protein [Geminicoccaceae bacterium]